MTPPNQPDPGPVELRRDVQGASILGPRNPAREAEDRDLVRPPATDKGTLPNLRWSFADSHNRIEPGGWARQTTVRELPVATAMAGVNMRLDRGGVREMHWHTTAEWSYVLAGQARLASVDEEGRTFQDDVGVGDLWYFPPGIPHSIQGLGEDGVEFLLVFDDGSFSEDSTFLLSDLFAHLPRDMLAKNFGWPEAALARIPEKELYIFQMDPPGPLEGDRIAAALVELEPGAMREVHWHTTADEWQYYLEGEGRMTVFASGSVARTFDYQAGDVGYVPFAMAHYVENTGTAPLRFLEVFASARYADLSLAQWMALTPHELVAGHLNIDRALLDAMPATKQSVVPA